MKVLIISTLKRRVDADQTASRSRIIYQMASKLTHKGHHVSLLGTKDSVVEGATVIPVIPKSFINLPPFENAFYGQTSYLIQLERKLEDLAGQYDIIHNHTYPEFINLFATERIQTPMVTTLHAQATPEYDDVLALFPRAHLVALSYAHKRLFTKAHIEWVVYNGIDTSVFMLQEKKEGYLLWLGRLGKAKDKSGTFIDAKGVRWAIELAQKTKSSLIISGSVEDMEFYERDVKPHFNDKIRWYGPVSSEQVLKREEVVSLMQGAKAFLMTINWEEPFGLVMAESMACGTPVIAFNRGSVPEIVRDGLTGFIIDQDDEDRLGKGSWVIKKKGVEGLVEAVRRIGEIDRAACRRHVEQHFTLDLMVENYEKIYQSLIR